MMFMDGVLPELALKPLGPLVHPVGSELKSNDSLPRASVANASRASSDARCQLGLEPSRADPDLGEAIKKDQHILLQR